MNEKNVYHVETLGEQIYLTMGPGRKIGIRSEYNLTFRQVGKLFKVKSPEHAREYYLQGKSRCEGKLSSPGRTPELSKDQEQQVIQHVLEMQNSKTPLLPIELLAWVNLTFNKSLSGSWPNKFVERNSNRLFIVDAVPLEAERADVTFEQLQEYAKKAEETVAKYDGRMVCNWDQTASEKSKETIKRVIIAGKDGKSTGKTYYNTEDPPGHITLMPVVFPNGDSIPPLIIISQATVDNDLEEFGLPDGELGMIISTTSLIGC